MKPMNNTNAERLSYFSVQLFSQEKAYVIYIGTVERWEYVSLFTGSVCCNHRKKNIYINIEEHPGTNSTVGIPVL